MSSSNSVATTRDEIDVEAELASYRGATVDAISKFKQSVRPGGQGKSLMSVDAVCRHLSIPPSNKTKEAKIDLIVQSLADQQRLVEVKAEQGRFRKDKNTFPRLLNLFQT